jgi:hypothetical protein
MPAEDWMIEHQGMKFLDRQKFDAAAARMADWCVEQGTNIPAPEVFLKELFRQNPGLEEAIEITSRQPAACVSRIKEPKP